EGEHNKYFYKSIGTGVTIPPWNFPLQLWLVQHLAPVVAGNTVLLKPAEDTVKENITSTSINQLVLVLQFHLGTSHCNYGWYNI
ncbi:aldehyde dehydrogenase family protein, partial [Staphylococcus aureus]